MNWTEERIEKLKKLWAEGLSANKIAAQLGGISRNAVIGKAHRLSLDGRAKQGRPHAVSSTPRAPSTTARRTSVPSVSRGSISFQGRVLVRQEIEIEPYEEPEFRPASNAVVPIARRLGLDQLTERTCKWPVGDPLKDDFFFCGYESPDASPYCTYHQRLAYQPVHERRRGPKANSRGDRKLEEAMA